MTTATTQHAVHTQTSARLCGVGLVVVSGGGHVESAVRGPVADLDEEEEEGEDDADESQRAQNSHNDRHRQGVVLLSGGLQVCGSSSRNKALLLCVRVRQLALMQGNIFSLK